MINSTITSNHAGHGGGINNNDLGKLTVLRSTISNNTADSGGGGIISGYFDTSVGGTQVTVVDSTIVGNSSGALGLGGGIARNRGTLALANTTVSGNTGHLGGGGIADSGTNNGPVSVNNCTITGNSSATAGVTPNPPAEFSALAMLRSIACWLRSW